MSVKRLFALPLLALPLLSQEAAKSTNPFEFQATGIIANGDMNKMVRSGNLAGYALGFAVRSELKPGLNTRLHGSFMSLRGANGTGMENPSRPHVNVGIDVLQDVGAKWGFFGGLTGTYWKQSLVTNTLPSFSGANSVNGLKLGFRVGAEYAFSNTVRGQFAFNQAEFNKLLNPSWYSLGVVYRFQ